MKFTARMVDGWLPLPPEAVAELGWREGDTIEIETMENCAIAHRGEEGKLNRIKGGSRVQPTKLAKSLIKSRKG